METHSEAGSPQVPPPSPLLSTTPLTADASPQDGAQETTSIPTGDFSRRADDPLAPLTIPNPDGFTKAASESSAHKLTTTSTELQTLNAFARSLQQIAMLSAEADKGTAIDALSLSAKFTRLTVDMCHALNASGDASSSGREHDVGEGLIEIHLASLVHKRKSGIELTPAEHRMLATYSDTHDGKLKSPSWFAPFREILEVTIRSDRLPGPDAYLEHSPTCREKTRVDCQSLRQLSEELLRSRQSRDPDEGTNGPKTEALREEIAKLTAKLDRVLLAAKDVDPLKVVGCLEGAHVRVTPKMQIISELAKACNATGSVLEKVLGIEQSTPLETLSLPIIGVTHDAHSRPTLAATIREVPASRFQNEAESRSVDQLLSRFLELRICAEEVLQLISSTPPRLETEDRDARSALRSAMASLFPGGSASSRKALLALESNDSDSIRQQMPKLLTCRVLGGTVRSGDTLSFIFESPANISALGIAMRHLIRGSDESCSALRETLESAGARSVLHVADPVRKLIKDSDISGLVEFFDRHLEALRSKSHVQQEERATLLQALTVVTEEPKLRRALRGRLRNLEAASEIANSLCDSMAGGSEHAQFTEQMRARLNRRLSSDLSNYWGQTKTVEKILSRLKQNLLFLDKKWAWEGMPSGQLIPNGFLLYGEPGAGKTFFVQCLANELELPLVAVSREELGKAMQKAAKGEVSDMEQSLGDFLESKVKEALDRKQRSGARSVILFIDEMEAEFLQRDPKTGERAELARTNIMLRVIERMMGRYPEIQFFAATNHIEQVDRAALRFGRYGMHFEFALPTKEDVQAIISACLAQEGLEMASLKIPQAEIDETLKLGEKMVPLAIQMSINNAIALTRIAQEKRDISVTPELVKTLQSQLELIRTMNTIHDQSATLKEGAN